MIKLTALHYTIKTSALERFHNINENSSRLMFDWEKANERATNTGEPYTNKPFIEPFDFETEDYVPTCAGLTNVDLSIFE